MPQEKISFNILMLFRKKVAFWKLTFFSILFSVFSFLIFVPLTHAAIPQYINFQGKLTDSDGNPVDDDTYSITFRIYSSLLGGTALWTETHPLETSGGVFNASLGTRTDLDLEFDTEYWLSVQVGSDTEMTPRQRITAAGYALNADNLDTYTSGQFLRSDDNDSSSGQLTLTYPGSALIVQPSSAPAGDTKVIDIRNAAGTSKFSVEYEGDVNLSSDLTVGGSTFFGGIGYSWPGSRGSSGQALVSGADGTLSWSTMSASGNDLTLSGTNMLYLADGTATAPALTFSDDTNTGFYSPDDDMIAFSTGAAERLRVDDSGNVGIGTTGPQQKLHVQGNVRGSQLIPSAGDDITTSYGMTQNTIVIGGATVSYGRIRTRNNADLELIPNGTGDVLITNANVGIGTTAPSAMLDVAGDISVASDLTIGGSICLAQDYGNVGIGTDTPISKLEIQIGEDTHGGIWVTDPDDDVAFIGDLSDSAEKGVVRLYQDGTENARITSDSAADSWVMGNVGIGTTSPDEELEIYGDQPILKITDDGGDFTHLSQLRTGEFYISKADTGGHDISIFDNGDISIGMYGNIGIGTTAPDAILDINSDGSANGVKTLFISGEPQSAYMAILEAKFGDTSTNCLGIAIDKDATAGHAIRIQKTDDGTWNGANVAELFQVEEDGKVGIGTNTPETILDVEGGHILIDNNQGYQIENNGGGNISVLTMSTGDNVQLQTGSTGSTQYKVNNNAGSHQFWIGATPVEKMRITNAGNVGIGTNTPSARLDLQGGDASISGTLTVGGTTLATTGDGKVGIGTTSPLGLVHIYGDGPRFFLQDDSGIFYRFSAGTSGTILGFSDDGFLGIDSIDASNPTESVSGGIMMITSSGNIGIGTTDPTQELDVSGNVQISQELTVSGTIYEGGSPLSSSYLELPSSPAVGGILYYTGSGWDTLAPGDSGQVVQSQGAGSAPAYGGVSWTSGITFEDADTQATAINGKSAAEGALILQNLDTTFAALVVNSSNLTAANAASIFNSANLTASKIASILNDGSLTAANAASIFDSSNLTAANAALIFEHANLSVANAASIFDSANLSAARAALIMDNENMTAATAASIVEHANLTVANAASIFDHTNLTAAKAASIVDSENLTTATAASIFEHANLTAGRAASICDSANLTDGNAASIFNHANLSAANAASIFDNANLTAANAASIIDDSNLTAANAALIFDNANLTAAKAASICDSANLTAANAASIFDDSNLTAANAALIFDNASLTAAKAASIVDDSNLTAAKTASIFDSTNLTAAKGASIIDHSNLSAANAASIFDSGNITAARIKAILDTASLTSADKIAGLLDGSSLDATNAATHVESEAYSTALMASAFDSSTLADAKAGAIVDDSSLSVSVAISILEHANLTADNTQSIMQAMSNYSKIMDIVLDGASDTTFSANDSNTGTNRYGTLTVNEGVTLTLNGQPNVIIADTLTNNGTLSKSLTGGAKGEAASDPGDGGTGAGGVLIVLKTLDNNSTIQANGGNGVSGNTTALAAAGNDGTGSTISRIGSDTAGTGGDGGYRAAYPACEGLGYFGAGGGGYDNGTTTYRGGHGGAASYTTYATAGDLYDDIKNATIDWWIENVVSKSPSATTAFTDVVGCGAGGGSGAENNNNCDDGGGAGSGGQVIVLADVYDNTGGTISANGGDGGDGGNEQDWDAGGGGGGGGIVYGLYRTTLTAAGTLSAAGGTKGASDAFPADATDGTAGTTSTNDVSGADLAENYPGVPGEIIRPGDVVSIASADSANITFLLDEAKRVSPAAKDYQEVSLPSYAVARTKRAYDNAVLGIVSNNPASIIGPKDANSVPVALVGRVPVRIDPDSEPIRPGDYLTSSGKPGYAMKATQAGQVIGKALDAWNKDKEQVLAFVSMQWICSEYYKGTAHHDE